VQVTDEPASKEQLRLLHATIKKVSTETEEMRFNTGIAAMMEFINGVYKWDNRCAVYGAWQLCRFQTNKLLVLVETSALLLLCGS
jgi:leucyl-tRNA synthetase